MKRVSSRQSQVGGRVPYLYLLPALLLFTVFLVIPVLQSFYYSLFQFNGLSPGKFLGLQNFKNLFNEPDFYKTLLHTAVFTVANVVIQTTLALPLAVVLNGPLPMRGFFKSVFFFPSVMSVVVIGFVFQFILNPAYGTLNVMLDSIGLGALAQNWLGDPRIALYSVIFVTCWQGVGYAMVIYLGGLQGIPVDVLEAASIDGASGVRRFFHVTLPMLAPVLGVAVLLSTISNIQEFGRIYVLTGGGPAGATEVFVTYLYDNFNLGNYGYGSAVSVVLFIMLMALSLLQTKVSEHIQR